MSSGSLVGRVLDGRYRLTRPIAEGGMGAVYEAVQENLGRPVAVKVLLEQLADEARFVERFRREAIAAGSLMHPHIVQVLDFVSRPGEIAFMVMERLEGEALLALLRRGPVPPARACRIAVQILGALGAAHAAGIVHRDLKPGNVFLVPLAGGLDCVKLLDFGIAKLKESDGYSRLTATGVLVGTPRYAAPEQLASSRTVDHRADLYAMGVLLYCMLAGRPPFRSSGAQLLIDIQDHEPPDLAQLDPSLPPALVAAVRRAMRKRPGERFQTADEMARALEPLLDEGANAVTGPPRPAVNAASEQPTRAGRGAAGTATPSATPPPSMPTGTAATGASSTVAAVPWRRDGAPAPQARPPVAPAPATRHAALDPRTSGPPVSHVAEPALDPRPSASAPPSDRSLRWALMLAGGGVSLAAIGLTVGLVVLATSLGRDGSAAPVRGWVPAAYTPSSAATRIGPDCIAYERTVCTCDLPTAVQTCRELRTELAGIAERGDPGEIGRIRASCRTFDPWWQGYCQ